MSRAFDQVRYGQVMERQNLANFKLPSLGPTYDKLVRGQVEQKIRRSPQATGLIEVWWRQEDTALTHSCRVQTESRGASLTNPSGFSHPRP